LKERGLKGVKLFVSNTCLGLLENLADFYPEASWQRCVVHFYRNVWTAASRGKVKEMAAMLKAVHAQEDPQAAGEKAAHGLPCCRRLHAKWGIAQPPQCGDYEQEIKGVQEKYPRPHEAFRSQYPPLPGPKVSVNCAVLTMTKLAPSQTLAGTNDGRNLSPAGSEQASATPRKRPKR
jgi:hypothetical protein